QTATGGTVSIVHARVVSKGTSQTHLAGRHALRDRTSLQHAVHGGDQLIDGHGAAAVAVGIDALVDRRETERDVDTLDDLVDGDAAIIAAIASARGGTLGV